MERWVILWLVTVCFFVWVHVCCVSGGWFVLCDRWAIMERTHQSVPSSRQARFCQSGPVVFPIEFVPCRFFILYSVWWYGMRVPKVVFRGQIEVFCQRKFFYVFAPRGFFLRGSPVMSWILLKANNAQQASVFSEMCSICEQPLYGIILMILHTNKWCVLISDLNLRIFLSPFEKSPVLRDTRTALSLPAKHAHHDTMDPHWARTCWMVMGQWP